MINDILVLHEYDNEKNLRATADPSPMNAEKAGKELIKVVAKAIEKIPE